MRHFLSRILHGSSASLVFSRGNVLGFLLSLLLLAPAYAFEPENALVEIEISRKEYDERLPWISRSRQAMKNGVVLAGRRILTTADGLAGHDISRVRKLGESRPYEAEVEWIDFYANVAVLSVPNVEFWSGLEPVILAPELPQSGDVEIFRWRSGRVEARKAEIIRLSVGQSHTSHLHHLVLSVSSDMDGAGRSEIAIADGEFIGLVDSAGKGRLSILPSALIEGVLEQDKASSGSALGHFAFEWMPATNPALVAAKGYPGAPAGIVLTKIVGKPQHTLREGDLIVEIGGFSIDSEGQFVDPTYGRLSFEALATRDRAAGDEVPMTLWRDGEELHLEYTLPEPDFDSTTIPAQRYRSSPDYLVAGGLLFQPLTGPLLQALGNNKPLLLDYYEAIQPMEDREGIVLVGQVLPDDFNRGYETIRYAAVDFVNGQRIETLEDVVAALDQPRDGFHRIDFMPAENTARILLDASALPAADARILTKYRIPEQSSF